MTTVVVDRDGLFPEAKLSKIKTIIEPDTGVCLLGIIPHDVEASIGDLEILNTKSETLHPVRYKIISRGKQYQKSK